MEKDQAEQVAVKKLWQCEACGDLFSYEHCYETHKKFKHTLHQCETCLKTFSRAFNLKKHKNHCKGENQKVKCSLCDFTGLSKPIVCEHYVNVHKKNLNEKTLEFVTFEDFQKWKDLLEKNSKAHFVKTSSTKVLKSGLKICKYVCHRDGYFKSKSKGIRNQKILGTNKIDSYCPAEISVAISDKCINIKYVDTHLGHTNDLDRLVLSDSEKSVIAQKLTSKIPFDEILDEIRESITDNDLNRVHLLTRKDLWNIVDSFNLNHEAVLHKNDCLSVNTWVKHMQSSSNLIRCYKPQGITSKNYPELRKEDFFLVLMNDAQLEILKQFGDDSICIDEIHGLNAYDFQLFTLMVLDNVRQGFPCCFLFCNRGDTVVMTLFFNVIKECLNEELITPKTFMSDMDDTFYNAWSTVFGPVNNHLYCNWHVDRAWRNDINKINGKEKQVITTYRKLKIVMFETDQHSFMTMLSNLNNDLINDPDTREFGKYFEKYIAS